ncbi:hypothetical protein HMH01_09570 [Halovulum dunhuangense]|uniref:Transcription factor zinc-finger domain-containing protein n=1 Tax=Halovulum dunhuangense TaxID=1505036 RepID=A0A849L344_9RHOB|nr:zf-TFIIB domain-containing protein [Halovulum dunhuangense]NNU80683.1 hypothetical protein [Halovulum dunhuangense]
MQCPVDGTTLVMSDRNGVEIDYCPACRGVWLDRGELDKIIERSAAQGQMPPPPPSQAPSRHQARDDYRSSGHGHTDEGYRKKKRGGFLEDLFDF